MPLMQRYFLHDSGDRAVIWVDPRTVDLAVGSKWPVGKRKLRHLSRRLPAPVVAMLRPFIKHREPFVIPRADFATPRPVAETPRYIRVADVVRHRGDVGQSAWYRDLLAELEQTGCARHKTIEMRSEPEIRAFFASYVLPLIESLEREGYRCDDEGYASTAVIGPQGDILKAGSGNHRFCVAKVLGLDLFPLRIVGAHQDWAERTLGKDPEPEQALAAIAALSLKPRAS